MDPVPNVEVRVDQVNREVAIAGELDLATRSVVTTATDELNAAGDGDIALDLDDVTFIDAAGVGAVVAANNEQVRRHFALNVRSSGQFVRRVFTVCRLGWMLTAPTRIDEES